MDQFSSSNYGFLKIGFICLNKVSPTFMLHGLNQIPSDHLKFRLSPIRFYLLKIPSLVGETRKKLSPMSGWNKKELCGRRNSWSLAQWRTMVQFHFSSYHKRWQWMLETTLTSFYVHWFMKTWFLCSERTSIKFSSITTNLRYTRWTWPSCMWN